MGNRLPQTTPRKMIKALQRLGFVIDDTQGSHYYLSKEEHRTCVAMHNRDIPRKIMIKIIKQAGLTINEIRPYL